MAGSPTVRRRRLSRLLKQLREASGKTAVQVARDLKWPSASKVTRIEGNVWKRPYVRDVEAMLRLYGVEDSAEWSRLVTLAREARQRGWWQEYDAGLAEQYEHYIGLEDEAAIISTFEHAVPGLVQTEDYALAAIRAGHAEITDDQVEQRAAVRRQRQQVLTRPDPVRFNAVIDEAALHRCVGGPDVMRAQMRHLLEVAEYPRVTLQVIPFEAGLHPGIHGPFVNLDFSDPTDPSAVYVENLGVQVFFEEPSQLDTYRTAFQHLVAMALSPGDTIERIAKLAK